MAYKETVVFNVSGNSTQQSTVRTVMDNITLHGAGNITIGLSEGKLLFSGTGVGTGFTGTNATGTLNSNGLQLSVAAGGGANINVSAGTTSNLLSALTFNNGNGITFGLNASTITASHNGLTTARASNDAIGLNTAITQNGVSMTANSSGLSLNFPAFLTTAQPVGAYLTTARASNDGVGLNTAQTNVTWTVNSSGISLNASGYAGIGTSATNASITLNSNGLAISVAAPGGGAAVNFSAGTTSQNLQSAVLANANGISFGLGTGASSQSITASHNGLTTAAASDHSHGNPTLALTNLTGTTASASNGFTISLSANAAGGGATLRDWDNFGVVQSMNLITNLTATGVTQRPIFFPMEVDGNLTWNRGMYELSKVTNSQDYAYTFNFGIYSFANSTSINLIASLQNVYNISSASSVSATGIRRFAFTGIGAAGSTLSAGHYVGMMAFSAGAGGTSGINASLRGGVTANPPLGLIGVGTNNLSTANLSSIYLRQFRGLYTTTSNVAPAAVALADVQGWTTAAIPYVYLQST